MPIDSLPSTAWDALASLLEAVRDNTYTADDRLKLAHAATMVGDLCMKLDPWAKVLASDTDKLKDAAQ